jgi:hypothetical protein
MHYIVRDAVDLCIVIWIGWFDRIKPTKMIILDRAYQSAEQQQPRLEPYQNQDVLLYACPKGILEN